MNTQKDELTDYVGKRIKIIDGSEAHGDFGILEYVENSLGVVYLENDNAVWIVFATADIELA